MKKFLAGIVVGVLLTVAGTYGYFNFLYVTPIGDIKGQADYFDDREVRVKGTVGAGAQLPFTKLKGYLLTDETGTIPVLSTDEMPKEGEMLTVRSKTPHIAIRRFAVWAGRENSTSTRRLTAPWRCSGPRAMRAPRSRTF